MVLGKWLEVIRRVVAKAALTVLRPDILEAAGVRQLCAGQTSGVESACSLFYS